MRQRGSSPGLLLRLLTGWGEGGRGGSSSGSANRPFPCRSALPFHAEIMEHSFPATLVSLYPAAGHHPLPLAFRCHSTHTRDRMSTFPLLSLPHAAEALFSHYTAVAFSLLLPQERHSVPRTDCCLFTIHARRPLPLPLARPLTLEHHPFPCRAFVASVAASRERQRQWVRQGGLPP